MVSSMGIQSGEFHWADGWYFSRTSDGSVHIEKRSLNDTVTQSCTIPSLEWVSIISHVGVGGSGIESFGRARELHLLKLDIAKVST